ncbi:MAG: MmgE/PrpD family protein [Acidimicrobiia bacterium]|nr:MmgE/PrpD family protein [Acidimicrobiia bacterium]
MEIAQQYAEYATTLQYHDLPSDVVDHAKKLVLDIIANDLGGHAWMESGPKVVDGVRALNRNGSGATVLATGESMAPEWATLVNGTMAHSLDYDNHHAKGVIHAGSSVVNAALAAAEENGSSGREFLSAVVIGYEIATRLAMALGPHSSHEMGFHPTATCATFAASALIGRLRGQSADQIVNAMGLNGSQAAGSMQYVKNGAWNKRAHPGWATHSAFVASTLAANGFIGAAEVFEGDQGFFQGYALRPRPEEATRTLGTSYETLEVAIKPFSLCRYTHQALDLLITLTNEREIDPDDVESIVIDMPTYGVQLCGSPIEAKRAPTSAVDAQFSGPFAAALALTERKAGMDVFVDVLDNKMDDRFRRLMNVTDVHQADDLDAIHPEFWPGRVTVNVGGEIIERYSKHMKGEKERPMSFEDVEAKLRELSPNHSDDQRDAVAAAVRNIEDVAVADLVAPLRA